MIDLDAVDLDDLDPEQLEELRDGLRRLEDRIEGRLEWLNSPVESQLQVFTVRQTGRTFYAEDSQDSVLINPALPPDFYVTPNEERSPAQNARWRLRPFIETTLWSEVEAHERESQAKLRAEGSEYAAADLEGHIEMKRLSWFRSWPSGVRHDVLCLDGGSWDRPSDWGQFGTLQEALDCVNARCNVASSTDSDHGTSAW